MKRLKKLLVVCTVLSLTLSFISPFTLLARDGTIQGGGGVCLDTEIQSRGPNWVWSSISYCSLRGQWRHTMQGNRVSVQTIATTANTWSLAIASNNNDSHRGSWRVTNEVSDASIAATLTNNRANWQLTN